jgi:hypothetical protein
MGCIHPWSELFNSALQPASDVIRETIFYIANTLTIKSPTSEAKQPSIDLFEGLGAFGHIGGAPHAFRIHTPSKVACDEF